MIKFTNEDIPLNQNMDWTQTMYVMNRGGYVSHPSWSEGSYIHRACGGTGTLKMFAYGNYHRVLSVSAELLLSDQWFQVATPVSPPALFLGGAVINGFEQASVVGQTEDECRKALEAKGATHVVVLPLKFGEVFNNE